MSRLYLINVDDNVSLSEFIDDDRNSVIAYLIKNYGISTGFLDALLDLYCDKLTIEINYRQLVTAELLLAKCGVDASGKIQLDPANTHRLNALQSIAIIYDAAGEFAFRVGLPAKSGVSGGILATILGKKWLLPYGWLLLMLKATQSWVRKHWKLQPVS